MKKVLELVGGWLLKEVSHWDRPWGLTGQPYFLFSLWFLSMDVCVKLTPAPTTLLSTSWWNLLKGCGVNWEINVNWEIERPGRTWEEMQTVINPRPTLLQYWAVTAFYHLCQFLFGIMFLMLYLRHFVFSIIFAGQNFQKCSNVFVVTILWVKWHMLFLMIFLKDLFFPF